MTDNRPRFYDLLASAKSDGERAAVLDEWTAEQPEVVRNMIALWVFSLQDRGMGEYSAKALLAMLICYMSAPAGEQDRMTAHGERVQHAYEWERVQAAKRMEKV